MELPAWLKIENLVKNLNLSNLFYGWFRNENINKTNIKKKEIQKISENKSVVTGDGNVVNHIYNIGVGDPSDLLKKPPSENKNLSVLIYEHGFTTLNLTETQIKEHGDFLMDFYKKIYEKTGRKLGTTKNAYNMLKGVVFAVGSEKFDNPDWKRQASSSLREIIYVWKALNRDLSSDFAQFYNKGIKLTEVEKQALNDMLGYYEYFSAVHHNDEVGIVNTLISFKKVSTLEIEDCLKRDVLIEQVKNFFDNILIISTFANKGKQYDPD